MIKSMRVTPEFIQDLSSVYGLIDPKAYLEKEHERLFKEPLCVLVCDMVSNTNHLIEDDVSVKVTLAPTGHSGFIIEWIQK